MNNVQYSHVSHLINHYLTVREATRWYAYSVGIGCTYLVLHLDLISTSNLKDLKLAKTYRRPYHACAVISAYSLRYQAHLRQNHDADGEISVMIIRPAKIGQPSSSTFDQPRGFWDHIELD